MLLRSCYPVSKRNRAYGDFDRFVARIKVFHNHILLHVGKSISFGQWSSNGGGKNGHQRNVSHRADVSNGSIQGGNRAVGTVVAVGSFCLHDDNLHAFFAVLHGIPFYWRLDWLARLPFFLSTL